MRAASSPPKGDIRKTKAQLIAELELWRSGKMTSGAGASDHAPDFSSAQLAGILQAADDAIVSIDEKFRIRVFNEGAARIFGFAPEEVMGQSIDMLLPEKVRKIHRQHLKKFVRGKETVRLMSQRSEIFGVRKNGEQFPAQAAISKIEVEGKKFFTVILTDISERKRVEAALRENQRILQQVFEHMDQGISMVDGDLNVVAYNRKSVKLLEFPEAIYEGEPRFEDMIRYNAQRGEYGPGDIEEQVRTRVDQAKRFEPHQFERTRPDGTVIEIRGVPLPEGGFVTTYTDITKRKRAEEELRASQRMLQTVVDTIPHTLTIKDKHLRYINVNKGFHDVYGLTLDDVQGKTALEIGGRPEEEKIKVYDDDRLILSGNEETIVLERTRINKFGEKRQIEFFRSRFSDENGEVEGIFALALDITERKQAEEELRTSEQKFRNLIEASAQGVIVHSHKPLLVNQAAANIFGYDSPEELQQINDINLIFAPHERSKISTRRAARLRGEDMPENYEFQGIRKDGQLIWLDAYVRIIDWVGEQAIQCSYIDITERKQAEAALRESEERFRSVIDHSSSAIFLNDLRGRYTLINRVAAELYHQPQKEIIGMTAHDLLPHDVAENFEAQDREVLNTGGSAQWEHEFHLPDGTLRTVINTKFPVLDGEGRIMGVGAISTDVTEQRKLEQHLRESQKMEAVGQLAGGIAHEFNNMLQVVINSAQFLKTELEDSGKKDNLVDIILQASERSASLTRQLLAFSRKSMIQPEILDLAALVSNEMAMLRQVIGENIRIEFQAIENLWTVKADPGMMEQIILNLCINARDAMRDGGRIVIETENLSADEDFCERHGLNGPGDHVMVTVRDDGAGMAPEVLERVFEPFFTTKQVGQGTGLGLAMVQGAVQQHDGTISVSSKLGSGTTFTFYLPRSGAPTAATEQLAADIAGGNELILLAEDEGDVLDILTLSLQSKGYEVIAAKDGAQALAIFTDNAERIHLVILDMVMPNMNGREVFENIRAMGSNVPILFSSGYAPGEDDFSFLNHNGIPLIQKPYALNEIFSAVRDALDGGLATP